MCSEIILMKGLNLIIYISVYATTENGEVEESVNITNDNSLDFGFDLPSSIETVANEEIEGILDQFFEYECNGSTERNYEYESRLEEVMEAINSVENRSHHSPNPRTNCRLMKVQLKRNLRNKKPECNFCSELPSQIKTARRQNGRLKGKSNKNPNTKQKSTKWINVWRINTYNTLFGTDWTEFDN